MIRPPRALQVARGLLDALVDDTKAISRVVAELEVLVRTDDWTDAHETRYLTRYRAITELLTRYRKRTR